jgi:NUMOD3 motif
MKRLTEGPRKAYFKYYHWHKCSARECGIEFLLTFDEWYKIWFDSGHLHERGPRKEQYCMARFGDSGPYAVGNVKIITMSENSHEGAFGKTPSSETRKKMSASGKVKIFSESHRMKISIANTGKKHSDEAKKKMSKIKLEANRQKSALY